MANKHNDRIAELMVEAVIPALRQALEQAAQTLANEEHHPNDPFAVDDNAKELLMELLTFMMLGEEFAEPELLTLVHFRQMTYKHTCAWWEVRPLNQQGETKE